MTNKRDYLKNFEKKQSKIEVATANESMIAKGSDSIEFENCNMKNVLYVPELNTNLLSVHAVTENGGKIEFLKNKVTIKLNNKVILSE